MIHSLYTLLAKPLFFLFDAEFVHDRITAFGEFLGSRPITRFLTKLFFYYKNTPYLSQKVAGIQFENPIGLAAGFDYEGRLTQILPFVGFGHSTVGSITYGKYEGNIKPRLGRLPKSQSLLVNKGLKNSGTKSIITRLTSRTRYAPIGISVAKTNSKKASSEKNAILDYKKSFKLLEKSQLGDYYELNISCPNAFGGEPFTTAKKLERLLREIDKTKLTKPLFVKMPIELTNPEANSLLQVIVSHKVTGIIIGNLAKDRTNEALDKTELATVGQGNFSGKPTWEKSNRLISFAYKKYHKKLVIIGCGGVFSAEDAYHKIKLGATLIQMITGMVYEGPQVIGEINRGLVELLKKDGYTHISQAIGSSHRK